jgi:hypothetical protein
MTIVGWMFEHPYLATISFLWMCICLAEFRPFIVNIQKEIKKYDGRNDE